MGRFPALVLGIMFVFDLCAAVAPPPTKRSVLVSPNGKYEIEFANALPRRNGFGFAIPPQATKRELVAVISEVNTERKWRRRVQVPIPDLLSPDHAIISNDGEALLLLPGASGESACHLHLLFSSMNYPDSPVAPMFHLPLGHPYGGVDPMTLSETVLAAFDFVKETPFVRIWDATTDRWLAFDFSGDKVTTTQAMIENWNANALTEIRNRIQDREIRDQQTLANRFAARINFKVRRDPAPPIEDVEYEFLAARRLAADRTHLVNLFEKDDKWKDPPYPFYQQYRPDRPSLFSVASLKYQRVRADHFLAIWENKIQSAPLRFEPFFEKQFFTGRIGGHIKLAMPITTKPGKLHIHLIPAALRKKDWSQSARTETLSIDLPPVTEYQGDLVNDIEFSFFTALAGDYFLKAIWDRRAPHNDFAKAAPGDYESEFIPVKVEAGNHFTLLVQCTNRIAGAEGYYAADEALLKQWSSRKIRSDDFLPFAFTRPIEDWIIATNKASPTDLPLQRISIVRANKADSLSLRITGFWDFRRDTVTDRALRLAIQIGTNHFLMKGNFKPLSLSRDERHEVSVTFNTFPRDLKTFRLLGYSMSTDWKSPIFDYTLTNLYTGSN